LLSIPELSSSCEQVSLKLQLTPWLYTYFDFIAVFGALVGHSGEPTSKTLLGKFKSELLHSWDQQRYQWIKGNVHLSHASIVLSQAIRHEIPCLQMAIERNQRLLQTIQAKASELSSAIASETRNYETLFLKHELNVIGLEDAIGAQDMGSKVRAELSLIISSSLPADIDEILQEWNKTGNITEIADIIAHWMKSTLAGSDPVLPSLHLLLDQGATYILPKSPLESTVAETVDDIDDTIDWGDFDLSTDSVASSVTIIESLDSSSHSSSTPHLGKYVMEDLETMAIFLKQRISELTSKNDFLDLVMGRAIANLPSEIQVCNNTESLMAFHEVVKEAQANLREVLRKLAILNSDLAMNEVISSLTQKRAKLLHLRRSLEMVDARQQETVVQLQQSIAKLDYAKKSTLDLQQKLEAAISAVCKGRIVHISVPTSGGPQETDSAS